jgi:hypothetical protein
MGIRVTAFPAGLPTGESQAEEPSAGPAPLNLALQ